MYDKLFDVLQSNYNLPTTPKMMKDMGMKLVSGGQDNKIWWIDDLYSSYVSIYVNGDEPILDVVSAIIQMDSQNNEDEHAENLAGESI